MSTDKKTLSELFSRAQKANLLELIPMLQDSPELAKATDEKGITLLFKACVRKDLDHIVALLSEGADPNQGNNYGVKPLEVFINRATKGVQPADNYNDLILRVLVESGAYPTDKAVLRAEDTGHNEWANYMAEKASTMLKP